MKNVFAFLCVLGVMSACQRSKEDNPAPIAVVQTVRDLPADPTTNGGTGQPQPATGRFTLYSLRENALIPNGDSATMRWDIGFRGTTIIVNGGAVRSGSGGAYLHTGLFEELRQIPENQFFNTDQSPTQLAIPTGSGTGWYLYNPASNWISPIAGRVLVIRTGDGRYAKVEILSYYHGAPSAPSPSAVARHYTFRYLFQPDGSRRF